MSDKLLISTRKGLSRSRGAAGNGRSRASISSATTSRSPSPIRATAVFMRRSTTAISASSCTARPANGWEEIAAPAYPPKPEGYEENDMWGRPLTWSTARIWALAAGGADEPGVHLVRDAARRPVPLDGPRRRAGHDPRALWDHPKRKQWMGGGADLPGHPFDLRRSARFPAGVGRGLDRRHLVHRGRRRDVDAARRKACAPNTCRPSRRTIRSPGRALSRAVPCGAGAHVGAASQRHLRLVGRGPDVHGDHRRRAVGVRLCRSPCIRGIPTPLGSCRRSRTRSASRARASWW